MTTCDLCGKEKPVCTDHDHATGLVRGDLCVRCNVALGWFEKHAVRIIGYINGPQGEPYVDVLRRRNAERMRTVYAQQRATGTYSTPVKRERARLRQRAYRERQRARA